MINYLKKHFYVIVFIGLIIMGFLILLFTNNANIKNISQSLVANLKLDENVIYSKMSLDFDTAETVDLDKSKISKPVLELLYAEAKKEEKRYDYLIENGIEEFPDLTGYYNITINLYNSKRKFYVRLLFNLDEKMNFTSNIRRGMNKEQLNMLLPFLRSELQKIKKVRKAVNAPIKG